LAKKVLILPDAGPKNPFQYQLIALLERAGFEVRKARSRRFFTTLAAVRRHRPDVLYFDWIQSFVLGKTLLVTLLKCACFCLEILYVKEVKRLFLVHTLHNIQNHSRRWVRVERAVYRWFLHRCDRVRVYSDTTRRKIIRFYGVDPAKVRVVQDVPYHHYYPQTATPAAGRAALGVPAGAFVFLFLGMVKPYKGLEDLIDAFTGLPLAGKYLVIAGASDQEAYGRAIGARLAGRPDVLYHNFFIDPDQVQYYFAAADVAVFPFRKVEHSGSVDLALSFGKAVITLDTPFMRERLGHQAALLYSHLGELPAVLARAGQLDLPAVGRANFGVADRANYNDMLLLFG
jgi:glycosyltransferase involved in cell wall biosynthesis